MKSVWGHIIQCKAVKGTVIGLGGLAVFGGVVFLGKKVVGGLLSRGQEKKSLIEGSPASYAKRIKMAFENDGWPGTKVTVLRQVIREIPSQQVFAEVAKAYQQLQYGILTQDLSGELATSEYHEIMAIITSKPRKEGDPVTPNYRAWAGRLKSAFDYNTWGFMEGTDEDAIRAVFMEIPSKAAFSEVAKAYKEIYGTDLKVDLNSEGEWWDMDEYMEIIESKPAV